MTTGATIPHPAHRLPLVGDLLSVDRHRPMQSLMEHARRLGPIFEVNILGYSYLLVCDPELVAELGDDNRFAKRLPPAFHRLRALLGDGLLTASNSEPNWAKAHNVLSPAFSLSAMRNYHDTMCETVGELIEYWDGRPAGTRADVPTDMSKLTLETIARTGFGYEFGSFRDTAQDPFVAAMVRALTFANSSIPLPIAKLDGVIRRKAIRQNESDHAYLKQVVDDVIRSRRDSPEESTPSEEPTDLLGLMLTAVDADSGEHLDEVNIRNQVITFLIAGHETTSGALSFALHYLACNPDIAATARNEIYAIWPEGADPEPVFEEVHKLRFVRRIVDETLRLWPIAPGYFRKPLEDTTLGGQYPVRAGTPIYVFIPQAHRHPVWGPNPDAFDPDRFLPERARTRPAGIYKPFGTGMRSCIGRQFALHETVLALALILHRYDLEPEPGYQLRVKELLTLKPEGLRLGLRRRCL